MSVGLVVVGGPGLVGRVDVGSLVGVSVGASEVGDSEVAGGSVWAGGSVVGAEVSVVVVGASCAIATGEAARRRG